MVRWFRLLLSIFALVGLMASAPAQAFVSHAHYSGMAHHECCPGMGGAHHDKSHDHSSLPGCCIVGFCACHVATPCPLPCGEMRPALFSRVPFIAPTSENGPFGQSRPPDLRPPIA